MQISLDKKAGLGLAAAGLTTAWLTVNATAGLWKPGHQYSLVTGYILLAIFVLMWLLPSARMGTAGPATRLKRWHEFGGIAVLAIFGLHAVTFKQNLMFWLSILIIAEGIVGVLQPRLVSPYSERYFRLWWYWHIIVGCAITSLALIHLYSAYAYRG